jgi:hypothetical protein
MAVVWVRDYYTDHGYNLGPLLLEVGATRRAPGYYNIGKDFIKANFS